MFFGDDYHLTDKIIIKQPKVGDILQCGENNVYGTVNIFVANTTMYRVFLWKNGIDWNKISDFELFTFLIRSVDHEYSKLLFGDLDFSKFKGYTLHTPNPEHEEDDSKPEFIDSIILYDEENDITIDEPLYLEMREYIREMFNIHPKNEFAKGKTTKQWMIDEESAELERKQNTPSTSSLFALISTCINHPGFKYKLQELRDVGIVQFMDSVNRLQVYEQSSALLKGAYSGFVDSSKLPQEDMNFFRDIYKHS